MPEENLEQLLAILHDLNDGPISKLGKEPANGWLAALYGGAITDMLEDIPDSKRGKARLEQRLRNRIDKFSALSEAYEASARETRKHLKSLLAMAEDLVRAG